MLSLTKATTATNTVRIEDLLRRWKRRYNEVDISIHWNYVDITWNSIVRMEVIKQPTVLYSSYIKL